MGGGVSLGTFSAGALAQVVEDLERAVDAGELASCDLDVWAGASAGAVTLAMTVHELFRDKPPKFQLDRLWVDQLDIAGMYASNVNEHTEPAIFDSELLRRQLDHLRDLPKTGIRHKLLPDARPVHMGFSLTNLNGIHIEADLQQGFPYSSDLADAASTTLFKDYQRFVLTEEPERGPSRDGIPIAITDHDDWDKVARAAKASGAFPLAFDPQEIHRVQEEYGYVWPDEEPQRQYAYADGGVFDNEPLKVAMEMARKIDREHPDPDLLRVFIVIDPTLSSLKHADNKFFLADGLHENGPAGLKKLIGRLLTIIPAQSSVKDWLHADKINNRVEWSDQFTRYLARLLAALPASIDPKVSADDLDAVLDQIITVKHVATSGDPPRSSDLQRFRHAQLDKIRDRWEDDIALIASEHQALFVRLVALLENATGLRNKRKLALIGIAPSPQHPPAGSFLHSFGGFFQRELRQHDYDLGRFAATTTLAASELPVESHPHVEAPQPLQGSYENLFWTLRRDFEDYLGRITLAALGAPSNLATRTVARFLVGAGVRHFVRRE